MDGYAQRAQLCRERSITMAAWPFSSIARRLQPTLGGAGAERAIGVGGVRNVSRLVRYVREYGLDLARA